MATKIGFWWSDRERSLPFPEEGAFAWTGKEPFLRALTALESDSTTQVVAYRGVSICRLCRKTTSVGNKEYTAGGFVWPQGFKHYVEVHNVQPPPEFYDYVISRFPEQAEPTLADVIATFDQFEYSSDGFPRRYPSEADYTAAMATLRKLTANK